MRIDLRELVVVPVILSNLREDYPELLTLEKA